MATFVSLTNASTGNRIDVNLDLVAFMERVEEDTPATRLHVMTGTDRHLIVEVADEPHEIILKAN